MKWVMTIETWYNSQTATKVLHGSVRQPQAEGPWFGRRCGLTAARCGKIDKPGRIGHNCSSYGYEPPFLRGIEGKR
jgi:hypothetical protein